jgi:hypothetical protein
MNSHKRRGWNLKIGERSRSGRDPLARQAIAVDDDRSALVGADPQPGGHMPVRQAFLSGGIIQATLLLATWAYETGQPPERSRRELEVSGMTTRPVQFVGHAVEKCRAGQWGQHCGLPSGSKRFEYAGTQRLLTSSVTWIEQLDLSFHGNGRMLLTVPSDYKSDVYRGINEANDGTRTLSKAERGRTMR